jgi:hypothetical protein
MRCLAVICLALVSMAPFVSPSPAHAGSAPRGWWSDVKEIDMNDLTGIEYEEGKPLPDKVMKLDGERVKISGYMDVGTGENAKEFRLASDNCGCNGRKVHHFVKVKLKDKTVGYSPNVVRVTGTMAVGEEKEDGYVTSIYRLEADTVE